MSLSQNSQNFPTIPHMNEIDLGDTTDDVW